jgi:hypothetical protein
VCFLAQLVANFVTGSVDKADGHLFLLSACLRTLFGFGNEIFTRLLHQVGVFSSSLLRLF